MTITPAAGRGVVLVVALAAGLSGCMRAQAKAIPTLPPLDVPAPPPRDVEVAEVEPPPPPPPQEEAPPRPPATNAGPVRRPSPPRTEPRTDTPRAEAPAPPAEPPKPVEEPPKPPAPAATLQTTPPGAEEQVESAIRAELTHAQNELNRVDYRGLSREGRTQYESVKSFITQAQDALRKKNLVFAKSLADKAVALAMQLAPK
jgi:hypothetical protein